MAWHHCWAHTADPAITLTAMPGSTIRVERAFQATVIPGAVVVAVLRGAAVEVSAAEAEVAVACAELRAIVDDDVGKSLRVVA